jgi:hypothetical protein
MRLWVAPDARGGMTVVADRPDDSASPVFAFTRLLRDGAAASGNVLDATETVSLRGVPTTVSVYTNAARGDKASGRA